MPNDQHVWKKQFCVLDIVLMMPEFFKPHITFWLLLWSEARYRFFSAPSNLRSKAHSHQPLCLQQERVSALEAGDRIYSLEQGGDGLKGWMCGSQVFQEILTLPLTTSCRWLCYLLKWPCSPSITQHKICHYLHSFILPPSGWRGK